MLAPESAASRALTQHARRYVFETLGEDPESAQSRLSVEAFIEKIGPMKSAFTNAAETKALVVRLLEEQGCDLSRTCFDVPRLRVVTSGGYLSAGVGYAYKAHRDTWYASPPSQVNWWYAVFDAPAARGMAFYPSYFSRPLANTSAEFDYAEWCAAGRLQATAQITEDTRKHPLPEEQPDENESLIFSLKAGEGVLFSAAHLHATCPNYSGITRFSIDFRTLHLEDIQTGRAAREVDNAAKGTTGGDFLMADSLTPLAGEWVKKLRRN